ncbi:serine/threonine protein kinase, CMGC family, CDC2/CDK subfamily [Neohortaea acidophila]|uniref:Serine/threonine-protein kinase SSN3 n=1 Tax=Neohortaea acidophila TaxID=245834 RepID=A0A6A6Q0T1_9PEZI|nr:serine/threonine protein kinase, CMGC family, CDC2/CDK subfamily [Neohortaea acidophila]KAF2485892.1 serine/threonine protein kinase, CMGC family, CDC2/CDK subfamily [Neohortaea acidophila]
MNLTPYTPQQHVNDLYDIVGFISSGTYGRVYKAVSKRTAPAQAHKHPTTGRPIEAFAIKKFKPDKEGELQYTGISQSAIREMALCTELSHPALIHLVEIILEAKCIFMVFEYAEHDLLQIIHHHSLLNRTPIPASTLRSCLFQLISGLLYLHRNWVIHRDLKPANIMVTSSGAIKIGDLGLARMFYKPLHALFSGDKVVVTIWYRAPELLLGSRHYTPAIDLWAVGCIFAELMSLRPIFKGEEAKQDSKKAVPFQRNQMGKIAEILGLPKKQDWPLLTAMPEYQHLGTVGVYNQAVNRPVGLERWYRTTMGNNNYAASNSPPPSDDALDLLQKLLEYDPLKRLTAEQALEHPYFVGADGNDKVSWNCFEGLETKYPARKVTTEAQEIGTSSLPGTKRAGPSDDIGLYGKPGFKKAREG